LPQNVGIGVAAKGNGEEFDGVAAVLAGSAKRADLLNSMKSGGSLS
jgi:hypothetical protein